MIFGQGRSATGMPGMAWFACDEPERPTDPFVRWHYRGCAGCQIKVQALTSQFPDDPHVAWLHAFVTDPV